MTADPLAYGLDRILAERDKDLLCRRCRLMRLVSDVWGNKVVTCFGGYTERECRESDEADERRLDAKSEVEGT